MKNVESFLNEKPPFPSIIDLEEEENGRIRKNRRHSRLEKGSASMDVKDAETFIQGLEDRSKMFNKTETTDEITPMLVSS